MKIEMIMLIVSSTVFTICLSLEMGIIAGLGAISSVVMILTIASMIIDYIVEGTIPRDKG